MATKKQQPTKTLDYDVMTDAELYRELAAMYDSMLRRLHTHLQMGTGTDDEPPVPEALEAGLALHGRLKVLTHDFTSWGTYGAGRTLTGWAWGLQQFENALREASAAHVLNVEAVTA